MKHLGLVVLTTLGLGLSLTPIGGQQQPAPVSGAFVPGEIIVKFARGVSQAERRGFMTARGAAIVRRFDQLDLDHVRLGPGREMSAALAELRRNPQIAYAQPNHVYRIDTTSPPSDPLWLDGSLWGLEKIGAQPAWEAYGGGNGTVIIADIDTGVLYTHQDLAANMWRNPSEIAGNGVDDDQNGYVDDVFGIDTVNHDSNPIDDNGHGTYTSGTIAAVGNNATGVTGVNWNARILACKSLNGSGSGSDAAAIECFNYIVALKNRGENIRVSNNSWGSLRGGTISQALRDAMDAAGEAGILNVCSAGNNAVNTDAVPYDPASFALSSIVSVAASDPSDNRAAFSNYGVTSVDLAAPGLGILSTAKDGGYDYVSGTSLAAPHVAGAAALLASLAPALSVDALKMALIQNVDLVPAWSGVVASGGRLNVNNATRSVAVSSTVSVPNVVGLTQAAATTSITGAGLVVGTVTTAPSATVPAGSVIGQTPGSGSSVAVGSAVNLTVSSGPASTRVNVAATANGGTAFASSFYDASYPAAGALDGNRRGWGGGTGWNDGTPNAGPDWLEIHFAGAQPITEVDVFSVQDAYAAPVEPVLGQTFSLYGVTDFQVEYWTGTQWAVIPGGVIAGNTQVWRQLLFTPITTTAIRITVTRAADAWTRLTEVEAYTGTVSSTVSVPNVVGLTQAAATTSITGAGLVVGTVTTAPSATVPAGSVIGQTPGSGSSVAVGSAVNLTVSSGPASTRVNVAATANGGTAFASSFYNASYPAAGALDGNRRGWGGGTGWNDGTPNAGPDWLEIHFAGAQPITEVDVFSVQDAYAAPVEPVLGQTFSLYGVTDFQVEYWTGTQWAVIPGGVIAGNTQVWRQLLFTPITTTAIRITVTRAADAWTRLTEVEAYTTAPSSTVSVPNVVGLTQAAATTSITGAGLVVGTVTTAPSATVPAGSVIGQTPGSGSSVAVGNAVNLTVSSGPASTRVNVAATANGGTAFASSFYNASYPAAGALDGNRRGWGGGTGWNDGTPNAGPDWLEIHFAGAQPITEVDVFSVQDAYAAPVEPVLGQTFNLYGVTDFEVEYWTGTQWAVIPGGVIAGNTQVWRQLLFTPITTTAIRITVTRAADAWTRLTEVEAYTGTVSSTVSVPNVVGLTQAAATTSITGAGLVVGTVTTAPSATVPAGSVIGQTPGSGSSVAVGNAVNLTVSSGPASTRVNVAATANGGTAFASSSYSASYPAAGALDGNRRGAPWGGGTGWNDGTPNAGPDWLEIHFAGAQPITEVDVFSVQDAYAAPVEPVLGQTFSLYGVTDFQVEYWTGTQWAVIPGGVIAGNTQVWRQLLFTPITTTAIRITVTRAADAWTRLTEVEAYTTAASQPLPVTPSTITLRADLVGTVPAGGNATSPIAAGPHLLLLNQAGSLYRWNGAAAQPILTAAFAPPGVTPIGGEAMLNVAADASGTSVFVMFTSSSVPDGVPRHASPRAGADAWQVLYRYNFNGTALSDAQPIVALQVRRDGHTGGGMVTLDDGTILFATGDNGDAFEDGREYAQNAANHLSKILRIDPTTASLTVVGIGVRNVQRLFVNPNNGDPRLDFVDLGGSIAEEFNSVRIAALLAAPAENFGWGRNAVDALAREGTFYIGPSGALAGVAPVPEAGFTQPIAQFSRESASLVGVTGPVSSVFAFSSITSLFGDLPTGKVFAVTGGAGTPGQIVYAVNLVDSTLAPIMLSGLAGGRPDPRFFLFPDGTAGVLLERTGAFYRLTQISQ